MLKYRSETGGSRAVVIREDQSNLHLNECVYVCAVMQEDKQCAQCVVMQKSTEYKE